MNSYWGNMGNDAISYKPYGMLGNQGMGNQGMGNQGSHCCKDHKSHKSHHSGGNGGGTNFLSNQIGMNVRINRGGPESLQGKLIGVQSGYLVLKVSGGYVYVNTSHVKSVTDLPGSGGSHGSRGTRQYIMANGFVGVLRALTQKFVQINWGGPEKIEGFIAQVGNESLLLVVGPELVQIPLYHIKTVKTAGIYASKGSQGSSGNNSNNNNKNNNNNNNKSNSSGGSKSSGNKSSSGGNRSANNRNQSSKKSGKTSSTSGSTRGKKG
ncbi:hypothetical protein [Paenibacillus glycinis]|uniref:Spore coat protein B n=1 Tax=Paenibacillus glycinis TaxID=2697035 RepID=A0ABW9XV96_9BACL|nr:hypothetical protein [Paenibacillus glycinis]NBD26588.1 hypothetical protein [Paenibacillus glycinis]